MLLHASLPISLFGRCPAGESHAADQIDFRNIFPNDDGMAPFEGCGPDAEDRTRKMLERLAVRITREGEQSSGGGNAAIPAGYTYLGQLVSPDIVHSVPEGPDNADARQPTRNMRVDRMILDTLYGRGPGTTPEPFEVPRRAGQYRTRLRLGKCRLDGARPAGGPALDIPRIGCPEIDNLLAPGATETLLADPRNDVSLILSLAHRGVPPAAQPDRNRNRHTRHPGRPQRTGGRGAPLRQGPGRPRPISTGTSSTTI